MKAHPLGIYTDSPMTRKQSGHDTLSQMKAVPARWSICRIGASHTAFEPTGSWPAVARPLRQALLLLGIGIGIGFILALQPVPVLTWIIAVSVFSVDALAAAVLLLALVVPWT